MTFLEFLKMKVGDEGLIGEMARDILSDSGIPINITMREMFNYIDTKTISRGTADVFEQLKGQYVEYLLSSPLTDISNLSDDKEHVYAAERWLYLKKSFEVNNVYLFGSTKIYKLYCSNSQTGKALFFNLKSETNLNKIHFFEENKIYNATRKTSVSEAIKILEDCKYEKADKLNGVLFSELIDFLKINETDQS